jgi:hypothetical protein
MASIKIGSGVDASTFLSGVSPAPQERDTASAMANGDDPKVMTSTGIRAGQKLTVSFYDYFDPLPEEQGFGSAKLQLHYQVGGKEGDAVAPAQGWWGYGSPVTFDVPADVEGKMELTFKELRVDGSVLAHPMTYVADVMPAEAPVIKFEEGWNNETNAPLKAGGAFKIAYDVDRLRSRLDGAQNPVILAYVSFDGRFPESKPVMTTDALGQHAEMPEFRIPQDAKSLRIWFAGGPAGSALRWSQYDSDFQADFTAPIDP